MCVIVYLFPNIYTNYNTKYIKRKSTNKVMTRTVKKSKILKVWHFLIVWIRKITIKIDNINTVLVETHMTVHYNFKIRRTN